MFMIAQMIKSRFICAIMIISGSDNLPSEPLIIMILLITQPEISQFIRLIRVNPFILRIRVRTVLNTIMQDF